MRFYKVSEDFLQRIANYLVTRPYMEVDGFIAEVKQIASVPIAQEISNQTIELSKNPVPEDTEIKTEEVKSDVKSKKVTVKVPIVAK